jgi:hypothetical protein
VFIGVQREVTDLDKSVTCHVVAGQLRHMAAQPWSLASTNHQVGILLYRLLESVTVKPHRKRLHDGASHLGGLTGQPPLGSLVSGLCTLPPHVRYTPRVTLILVEFQISL